MRSKWAVLIATYTLTTAALMLIGGKVGDIIGRRLAFRIGMATFGTGAAITALAPSMGHPDPRLVDPRGGRRGADDPLDHRPDRRQLRGR
jgi:MFS family permease